MSEKSVRASFRWLTVSGLFFVFVSGGIAQTKKSFGMFDSIVKKYQSRPLLTPKSEDEYHDSFQKEKMYNKEAKFEATRIYLADYNYQLETKKNCEQMRSGKNKCIDKYDADSLKVDTDYVEALKEIVAISDDRTRKLNEARKSFTPAQMKRSPQRRTYERGRWYN